MAVCSQIHTKHINTMCGQNVEFVNAKSGGTYSDHWDIEGNYHAVMYCGVPVSRIYNLVTRCRYMVNFTPRCPLDTNLCGSAPTSSVCIYPVWNVKLVPLEGI
jgi:hypothetical protein